MNMPTCLHTAIFHSLEEQIAVIDREGNIRDVNLAWQTFGLENGLSAGYGCVGRNYLETLAQSAATGDSSAGAALEGIAGVLAGNNTFFNFEYPCHSPDRKRWFTMRVAPLHDDASRSLFIVSHHNVTQRKLAEQRIEQMALQDPLTDLGNRRAFHLFFNKELRANSRNRTPVGLALVDVDYFKSYNDEFGHAAGDQCLTSIGRILLAHARRPADLAARIGGDEFALILGNTGPDMARNIAESVLKEINDLKLVFGGTRQVTVSIGVLSVVPHEQQSEDSLIQETDKALYRAKSSGRNRVVLARI